MIDSKNLLTSASFITENTIITCNDKQINYFYVQPTKNIATIRGDHFIQGTSDGTYIYAVSQTQTAPLMSNFILVYTVESGIFVKSIELSSKILHLLRCDSLLYASLNDSIHAFSTTDFQLIATIERESALGIISATSNYLCYTDDLNCGTVYIASVPGYSIIKQIKCHKDSLIAINLFEDAFNTYLTTASSKGTLIRKFNIKTGEKITELRRGFRNSNILNVSSNMQYTIACTPTTLHIFHVNSQQHFTVHLSMPAITAYILNNSVFLITIDSMITFMNINIENNSVQTVAQRRLISNEVIKKSRRITI